MVKKSAVWRDHATETFMVIPPLVIATVFCFGFIIFHPKPKATAPSSLSSQGSAASVDKTAPPTPVSTPSTVESAEIIPSEPSTATTPHTANPQTSMPASGTAVAPSNATAPTPSPQPAAPNTSNPTAELPARSSRPQDKTAHELPIISPLLRKLAQ